VLTQSEAATLTGDSHVTKLSGTSQAGVGTCFYADLSGGGASGATILAEPIPGTASQQSLQAAMAQAVKSNSGTVQALSGVGDEAYSNVAVGSAAVVFAKGNTLVVIAANSSTRSGSSLISDVESFAMQVAGRL